MIYLNCGEELKSAAELGEVLKVGREFCAILNNDTPEATRSIPDDRVRRGHEMCSGHALSWT